MVSAVDSRSTYLSNTPTNLCIALYYILLYCVVLNCIVLLMYCYVDIIQYNATHKFVGVLDNPPDQGVSSCLGSLCCVPGQTLYSRHINRYQ